MPNKATPSGFAVSRCENGYLVHLSFDAPKKKPKQQSYGPFYFVDRDEPAVVEDRNPPMIARNLFEVALILEQAFSEPIFLGRHVADLTETEAASLVKARQPKPLAAAPKAVKRRA